MLYRILTALGRFNGRHPWSHNDAYAAVVVSAARRVRRAGGSSALDIGCGTGHLLVRLARVLPAVVGIEPDDTAAARAAAAVAASPGATVVHDVFHPDADTRYDLVSMVAVLHHLPLVEALCAVREAVAPGGRLVVVGLYQETRRDLPLSILSLVINPIVGILVHRRRAESSPDHMTAPIAEPAESFSEITEAMRHELPGVRVHRAPFWRYVAH